MGAGQTNWPPEPVLSNLLRYETAIERRLDKTISRLDPLQRLLKLAISADGGQSWSPVTPPLPAKCTREKLKR